MITVYGEGRGFRVVWLLEEMGLPYKLRPVDLMAGAENDKEFMTINPGGFTPALRDGEVTMVESIAIMEYLMARYGPTPLALEPTDPAFPLYKQFLLLAEAGLAMPANTLFVGRHIAPEGERDNFVIRWAQQTFESRLRLVTRQLDVSPYLVGDNFSAADIAVIYALEMADRHRSVSLGPSVRDYIARTTARDAYKRAMETCHATKAWAEGVARD